MKIIATPEDVTSEVLADAESVFDDWFAADTRIDWDYFIDRLAALGAVAENPYDFEAMDSPAIRKIQRHVRDLR